MKILVGDLETKLDEEAVLTWQLGMRVHFKVMKVMALVSNQFDAQFFFLICLFHFSTCFEQRRAHHQENQLYQYNIWYMSLCVGGRLVTMQVGSPSAYQTVTTE